MKNLKNIEISISSVVFALFVLFILSLPPSSVVAQTTWTTVSTSACTSAELRGVVFGGGKYVAVGDSGTIITSANGTSWAKQTTGTSRELFCVTWGNSLFVAAGDSGVILTSPDGTYWTLHQSATKNSLRGAIWADNEFIAVGINSTIITSPDGLSWSERTSPCTCDLFGIAFGGQPAIFVAVGGYLSSAVLTSPNGITWTSSSMSTATPLLCSVTWNGEEFVATGEIGTILTSPNGTSWTSQVSGDSATLSDIVWADNQCVLVGHEGVGNFGPILTSPTGSIWTARTSPTTQWLYGVGWGSNLFVAVGTNGTVIISPTGGTAVARGAPSLGKHGSPRIAGTEIIFDLASNEHVSLWLFDIQGRLVSVVLDGEESAGAHSLSFQSGATRPFGKYVLSCAFGATSLEQPVVIGR